MPVDGSTLTRTPPSLGVFTFTISDPTPTSQALATVVDPMLEGEHAVDRILTASKMLREDWRLVGIGLLAGRKLFTTASGGLNKKAFGQWCKARAYGKIDFRVRTDAMWMAENWDSIIHAVDISVVHPTHVRIAYNAALAGQTDPEDEDDDAPDTAGTAPEPAAPAQITSPSANPTPSPEPLPWEDGPDDEAPEPVVIQHPAPAPQPAPARQEPPAQEPAPRPAPEPRINIFNNPQKEGITDRLERLASIQIDRSKTGGLISLEETLKNVHSEALLEVAYDAMTAAIREGSTPKDAVTVGIEAGRIKEQEMIDHLTTAILDLGGKATSRLLRLAEKNPILNSSERRVTALLAHAYSTSNTEAERLKAVEALEKIKLTQAREKWAKVVDGRGG